MGVRENFTVILLVTLFVIIYATEFPKYPKVIHRSNKKTQDKKVSKTDAWKMGWIDLRTVFESPYKEY